MNWLKARLNEPSTHTALSLLLSMASFVGPSKDQPYILCFAAVLAALGFVLPEGVARKVDNAASKGFGPKT